MSERTQFQLDRDALWKSKGFTLINQEKPEIGVLVQAIRVHQPRGFGGVILRTQYLEVPLVRTCDLYYTDILNKDAGLSVSELEAWRMPTAEEAAAQAGQVDQ